jgi:plasmid stabilization system protein ParE
LDYRVDVTGPAEVEIFEAASYIARFSPDAADRWLAGLAERLLSLEMMPRRCALAPESREFETEIRQLMYGRRRNAYRIVFRIVEPDVVEVVAVRHGARDIMRRT